MKTKSKPEQTPSRKRRQPTDAQSKNKKFERYVSEQVMEKLGEVEGFNSIRSSNVFGDNWRVDVFCVFESATELSVFKDTKIDYSFFVRTDDSGVIIKSDPEIVSSNKFGKGSIL